MRQLPANHHARHTPNRDPERLPLLPAGQPPRISIPRSNALRHTLTKVLRARRRQLNRVVHPGARPGARVPVAALVLHARVYPQEDEASRGDGRQSDCYVVAEPADGGDGGDEGGVGGWGEGGAGKQG